MQRGQNAPNALERLRENAPIEIIAIMHTPPQVAQRLAVRSASRATQGHSSASDAFFACFSFADCGRRPTKSSLPAPPALGELLSVLTG